MEVKAANTIQSWWRRVRENKPPILPHETLLNKMVSTMYYGRDQSVDTLRMQAWQIRRVLVNLWTSVAETKVAMHHNNRFSACIALDKKGVYQAVFQLNRPQKVGEGAYKIVTLANHFTWSSDRTVKKTSIVAFQLKNKKEKEKAFWRGFELQEKLDGFYRLEKPPLVQMPAPIEHFAKTVLIQPRYLGDLFEISINRYVSIDNTITWVSNTDIVGFFIDVAHTLEWIHSKGFVHKDVRRENIQVALSSSGVCRGILLDYDMASPFGEDELFSSDLRIHYDPCMSRSGLATPYCDWFSLCVSLSFCFRVFEQNLEEVEIRNLRQRIYEDTYYSKLKSPDHYHRGSFRKLPLSKQIIWNLFYHITVESSKFLQIIKEAKSEEAIKKLYKNSPCQRVIADLKHLQASLQPRKRTCW